MFFGDRSEEQNNTYAVIQTTLKHFVSPLNSRQAVHKCYSSKPLAEWMYEVGRESRVAIESSYISGPISVAWQLIALLLMLLCSGIYECFDFTFHSFFAPKIANAIILYARKVLKTFNRHLNHNREFTMITRKTLHDHF